MLSQVVMTLIGLSGLMASLVSAQDFTVDLRTGASTGVSSANGFQWITPVTSAPWNAACNLQGVLKLTFNTNTRRKAKIVLQFASVVSDFAFHIGDSQTNNGYGGDASSQSNDAEIHAVGKAIYFYGRDKAYAESYGLIYSRANFLVNTVTMNISNGLITAENGAGFIYIDSDKMFALNGQSDFEGPVNYDLYFGFNRVVTGGRYGSGLCSASITWSA
ncbi:hypothetical protein MQA28_25995 [Escherichia coli]|nr:hypothetical protein [Escherichia coli]